MVQGRIRSRIRRGNFNEKLEKIWKSVECSFEFVYYFFLMFDTMEERGAFELEQFILLDIRWCRSGFDFGSLGGKFGNAMEERRFEKISGNHVFVECSFDKEFFCSGKGERFISLDISGLQERIRSSSREKGNERINRNPVFVECSFVFDEEFFFGNIIEEREDFLGLEGLNVSSFNFLKIYRGYRVVKSYWMRK